MTDQHQESWAFCGNPDCPTSPEIIPSDAHLTDFSQRVLCPACGSRSRIYNKVLEGSAFVGVSVSIVAEGEVAGAAAQAFDAAVHVSGEDSAVGTEDGTIRVAGADRAGAIDDGAGEVVEVVQHRTLHASRHPEAGDLAEPVEALRHEVTLTPDRHVMIDGLVSDYSVTVHRSALGDASMLQVVSMPGFGRGTCRAATARPRVAPRREERRG